MTVPTLDIGCGVTLRGDVGMDLFPTEDPRIVRHDLCQFPYPFPDGSFERVYAYDVLEHLPWGAPEHLDNLPQLMAEVHRILVPGGVFEIEVPHEKNWMAHGFPTHRRCFNEWSFRYFVRNFSSRKEPTYRSLGRFRAAAVRTEWMYPGHWHARKYLPRIYRITQMLRFGTRSKIHAELIK